MARRKATSRAVSAWTGSVNHLMPGTETTYQSVRKLSGRHERGRRHCRVLSLTLVSTELQRAIFKLSGSRCGQTRCVWIGRHLAPDASCRAMRVGRNQPRRQGLRPGELAPQFAQPRNLTRGTRTPARLFSLLVRLRCGRTTDRQHGPRKASAVLIVGSGASSQPGWSSGTVKSAEMKAAKLRGLLLCSSIQLWI